MGKLLDQFMAYYKSTSKKQRKADMDALSEYNKVGPRAMDYINNITKKK